MKISDWLSQTSERRKCLFCKGDLDFAGKCLSNNCEHHFTFRGPFVEFYFLYKDSWFESSIDYEDIIDFTKIIIDNWHVDYFVTIRNLILTTEDFPELKRLKKYIDLQYLK